MMDRKIALQVMSITNSQSQIGAFTLLLVEEDGERQLPIIIGPAEAQATALYLQGTRTDRPLTHELFMTSLTALGASLIRVLIYKVENRVFFSYIYLKKDDEITRIDARTSDAIALAVRAGCPILIYESILERECPNLPSEADESGEKRGGGEEQSHSSVDTPEMLEEELKQAIKDEDYELAARIRDQINTLNKNE